MPIQGLKFNILTGQEAHLSFQSTGSFTAYNPNDGYTLIALDRTATLLDYDHKLPSQSGGHFPGPINSYLSMYFVDQSGAGLSGQIIVYASADILQIPQFWSIGRAIQSQVTSLDLIQGTIPPAPPANTTRMWSDASGHLHLEQSTGTDYTVLDNTNYNSIITLAGDVLGPLSNTTVQYRNASGASVFDSGGTRRNHVTFGGETLWWAGPGGGFRWVNQGNSVQWLALDTAGSLVAANNITAGGYMLASQGTHYFVNTNVWITWAATTGALSTSHPLVIQNATNSPGAYLSMPARVGPQVCMYDAGSGNFYGLGINGAELSLITGGGIGFRLNTNSGARVFYVDSGGNTVASGFLQSSSHIYLANGGYIYWNATTAQSIYCDTTQMQFNHGGNLWRFIYAGPNLIADFQIVGLSNGANPIRANNGFSVAVGQGMVVGGTNLNGQSFFCAGGSGGPTGWQVISTERFKSSIVVIDDALKVVLDPSLHGHHYTKDIPPDTLHGKQLEDDSPLPIIDPQPEYGFLAEPWSEIAPDVVFFNEEGKAHMMDYGQVTAILFEAFKQYVTITDSRLETLEANA